MSDNTTTTKEMDISFNTLEKPLFANKDGKRILPIDDERPRNYYKDPLIKKDDENEKKLKKKKKKGSCCKGEKNTDYVSSSFLFSIDNIVTADDTKLLKDGKNLKCCGSKKKKNTKKDTESIDLKKNNDSDDTDHDVDMFCSKEFCDTSESDNSDIETEFGGNYHGKYNKKKKNKKVIIKLNKKDESVNLLNDNSTDSETSNNKFSSRLSLVGLSKILNINDLNLVKKIEEVVINKLKNELNFPIGEKNWVKDINKSDRKLLIEKLFELIKDEYPMLNLKLTDIIVRRNSYSMMQTRLRRERRAMRRKQQKQHKAIE